MNASFATHSSIPFCDHKLPHQPHNRSFSHSPSPLPTLPHRACFPREADQRPQSSKQQSPRNSPLPKIHQASTPRPFSPRVSSRRNVSEPRVPPPSPCLPSSARGGVKKRLGSAQHGALSSNGMFEFVLSNTPPSKVQQTLSNGPQWQRTSTEKDCASPVDSFIGQSPPPTYTRASNPMLDLDGSLKEGEITSPPPDHHRLQHQQEEQYTSNSFSAKSRESRSESLSSDTKLCQGDSIQTAQPSLEASPSIKSSRKPRRSLPKRNPSAATPLRLFPTSPANSIESNESVYPETIVSPITSSCHPLLKLQQQVSVFEDEDDEKRGLMGFLRWPSQNGKGKVETREKASVKTRKRECSLRNAVWWVFRR